MGGSENDSLLRTHFEAFFWIVASVPFTTFSKGKSTRRPLSKISPKDRSRPGTQQHTQIVRENVYSYISEPVPSRDFHSRGSIFRIFEFSVFYSKYILVLNLKIDTISIIRRRPKRSSLAIMSMLVSTPKLLDYGGKKIEEPLQCAFAGNTTPRCTIARVFPLTPGTRYCIVIIHRVPPICVYREVQVNFQGRVARQFSDLSRMILADANASLSTCIFCLNRANGVVLWCFGEERGQLTYRLYRQEAGRRYYSPLGVLRFL